jgi:prophage regulatory protein
MSEAVQRKKAPSADAEFAEVRASKLDPFLSPKTVTEFTGYSRQTLWRECNAGRFPKPIPLSPQRVAWLESEVLAWQRERINRRDNPEWKAKGGGRPPKRAKSAPKAKKPWRGEQASSAAV